MPDFLKESLGFERINGQHFVDVLLQMTVAFLLASLVAFRPWRRLLGKPKARVETAQAQVLIAVAATVVIAAIADSLARAFGLVGLGGFVRFRSPIKDPRDAAVMFLTIGLGMACAVGAVLMAVIATFFIVAVLILFDAVSTGRPPRQRVTFLSDDPVALLPLLKAQHPTSRVLGAPVGGAGAPCKLVLEMDVPENMDAAILLAGLREKGAAIREVVINED
jgi:hypothetical protein